MFKFLQYKRERDAARNEVEELVGILNSTAKANVLLRDTCHELRAQVHNNGMTPKEREFLVECERIYGTGGGIKTVLFRKLMREIKSQRNSACVNRSWEG